MNVDADWQDLAAEYVLGTLDAAERSEAAALIAADADFAALVSAWEHRLGELSAMVAPVNPPAELWAAIQQRLAVDAGQGVSQEDGAREDGAWAAGAGATLAAAAASQVEPEAIEADAPEADLGAAPFVGPAEPMPGDAVADALTGEATPGDAAGEMAASEETPPVEASSAETEAAGTVAADGAAPEVVEPEIAAPTEMPEPTAPDAQAAADEITQADLPASAPADGETIVAEAIAAESSAESREAPVALSEPPGADATDAEPASEPSAAAAETAETERAAEAAPEWPSEPGTVASEVVDPEHPTALAPEPASEPGAATPATGEKESAAAVAPDLFELDAAFRETAERIAAESKAARAESAEAAAAAREPDQGSALPASPAQMAEPPEALESAASSRDEGVRGEPVDVEPVQGEPARVEPVHVEPADVEPPDVAGLTRQIGRWRSIAVVFGALAAGLAAILVTSARAPHYLPEALRPPSEIRTVEVPRDVVRTVKVPSASAGRFVAVLQSNAAIPAFIITADVTQRTLTVRRVAAETQADRSYELWLISNRFQEPRSLGVIGASEFTRPPTLAAYDPETINDATFAVSLEPEGGSTTGQPTGPMLFSGKLVEAVPATAPAQATSSP